MLNRKIARVFLAGLLLGAGTAIAAPVSTNETASSPHAYQFMVKPAATEGKSGATGPVFPERSARMADPVAPA